MHEERRKIPILGENMSILEDFLDDEINSGRAFENGLTIKDEDHNQMSTYWISTNIEGISKRVHIDEKIAHLQHKADVLLNEINRLNKLKEKHK